MPCLCPRPERGSTIAASEGSARLIAIPEGMSSVCPGSSVSGPVTHARRSRPALPAVAYSGSCSRSRGSRTLTCKRLMAFLTRHGAPARTAARSAPLESHPGLLVELRDVRDQLTGDDFFRRTRERMAPLVVEKGQFVVVGADRMLREIGGKERQLLAPAFLLRIFGELLAFGGEPDTEGRLGKSRYVREDVGVRL